MAAMERNAKRVRTAKSSDNLGDLLEEPPAAVQFSPQLHALPSPVPVPPSSATLLEPSADPDAARRQPLLVMKFGGSSLAGVEHLRRVAGIVRRHLRLRPVLVLSAMGKTTNELLSCAERALETGVVDISRIREVHETVFTSIGAPVPSAVTEMLTEVERILSGIGLLKEISSRSRDLVVSFGERLSIRVFEALFNHEAQAAGVEGVEAVDCSLQRVRARARDSWEIGMRTTSGAGSANSTFSQVEVLDSSYSGIAACLAPLEVDYSYLPVVTGYIAKDAMGVITTLGRDGSDLTATVIGAAVHASEVQIWKDVSGILTTDPRLVPSAKPVRLLTYEEAAELTMFGAKVVHPAAVMPAWLGKVPISVRNSMMPEEPGTRIVTELREGDARESCVVAMTSKKGITMIVVRSTRMLGQHGFLAHMFQVINKFEASVDVVSTSEITVSLTLERGFKPVDLFSLKRELEAVATVEVKEDMGLLTLITAKSNSGHVLLRSFEVFESLGVTVEMVSHGASNVNVTYVVPAASLPACTRKLHESFFGC